MISVNIALSLCFYTLIMDNEQKEIQKQGILLRMGEQSEHFHDTF